MSDIRDRIVAWLDENGHEDWCPSRIHGACCDKDCECALGKLGAAVRVVLTRHGVPQVSVQGVLVSTACRCGHLTSRGQCQTLHYLADALGVTP